MKTGATKDQIAQAAERKYNWSTSGEPDHVSYIDRAQTQKAWDIDLARISYIEGAEFDAHFLVPPTHRIVAVDDLEFACDWLDTLRLSVPDASAHEIGQLTARIRALIEGA